MIEFQRAEFMLSVHSLSQLPEPKYPEIAFAGRSNVGKSSLMNALIGRKGYVKISSKPGKTQGLNFFSIIDGMYLVDLPGYGYAKVSKSMQQDWQKLIGRYLEERETLSLVVVIMDIRHAPKEQDIQLMNWLRHKDIPCLGVYTKADKLSGNQRAKNAALLDAGHTLSPSERLIFSSKTGLGLDELRQRLDQFSA